MTNYQISKQERIANMKESESKIIGSKTWLENKFPNSLKKINRQNLVFVNKHQNFDSTDYNKEALENGWVFDNIKNLWKHEKYKNQTFTSLTQQTKDGKKFIPYCSDKDIHGLAYNYKINGLNINIFSNKWLSEEFDTRNGIRRMLFYKKKEMKDQFSSIYENNEYTDEFNY